MNTPVCGTTACFPGYSLRGAVERLLAGAEEPGIGTISVEHVQLCPQNPGPLNEALCEDLMALAPETRFRLHANARVISRHHLFDASTYSASSHFYFEALADRSRRLGANAYSLHAGRRAFASLDAMRDNVLKIGEIFGADIRVGVEGLYPRARDPQLIDSWKEYEWLLTAGIDFAIDISHLKIVARTEGRWETDLVSALLIHPGCIEVHVSDNDGTRDAHRRTHPDGLRIGSRARSRWISWRTLLAQLSDDAIVFTEGSQAHEQMEAA